MNAHTSSSNNLPDYLDAERIAAALSAEDRARAPTMFWSRIAALAVVAALVVVVAPFPDLLFYEAFIAGLAILGVGQYLLWREHDAEWIAYVFVTLEIGLLTLCLLLPNPLANDPDPPQMALRHGTFVYFFIFVSAVSISPSRWLIAWTGVCSAAFWAVGVFLLVSLPGAEGASSISRLDPSFIDIGVQIQNIVVLLVVTGVLALGADASLRLLLRETASARRAANLGRYLPVEAVDALAHRDAPFGPGKAKEATILFTDIVGFSTMAESLDPEETLDLLREAHGLVEQAVFAHGGALDKFIGDGAMATFGAVIGDSSGAAEAIDCARSIIEGITALNKRRASRGAAPIAISVGVHHGPVIVGDVGSTRRMEFATIGDAVNVASRLEHMTRELGIAVAISEDTVLAAGQPDGMRRIGECSVRGRETPIVVWAL